MAMPCRRFKALKQSLTKNRVPKFTISDYCAKEHISYAKFYSLYPTGKQGLYADLIVQEVKDMLRPKYEGEDLQHIIYRSLVRIKRNKFLYLNIIAWTDAAEKRYLRGKLQDLLMDFLRMYAAKRYGISNRNLRRNMLNIYSQVYFWLVTDCQESVEDMYHNLLIIVPSMEGHRCSFERKLKY